MNSADVIVISIILVIILSVIMLMRKQKKNGSNCHSGCAGCSKTKDCSSKR